METLIKCSQVLYDNDISDKMQEITNLKNDISDKMQEITNLKKQLNIPKVVFKDMGESTEKTEKLKEEITNEIKVFLDTNWIRLCNQHCDEICLQVGIEEILFKFTKNSDYSYNKSWGIWGTITTLFSSLSTTPLLEPRGRDVLRNILISFITTFIEKGNDWHCALAWFKCNNCDKLDQYEDEGLCYTCSGND